MIWPRSSNRPQCPSRIAMITGRRLRSYDHAQALEKLVQSCTGTKFVSRFSNMMVELALDAVKTVYMEARSAPSAWRCVRMRFVVKAAVPRDEGTSAAWRHVIIA